MKQILIVDDLETTVRLTEFSINMLPELAEHSVEVHCFTDPSEVHKHVLGSPMDVRCFLITDWQMNGHMSGVELVELLHKHGGGRLNSALVATSHDKQSLPDPPDVSIPLMIIPYKPFDMTGLRFIRIMLRHLLNSSSEG
jgi:CheY-like chemotaxis protein